MSPRVLLISLLAACGPTSLVVGGGEGTGAPILVDDTDPIGDTDDTEVIDPDTGDTEPPEPDDDAIYAAFFDVAVIQTIDISLSDRAIRTLNNGTDDYQRGDVVVNGVSFVDVGVRLKGSSTYQDLDCGDGYCKAAFKIKLDEFVDDQTYGDLQRITLNNMTTDYTQSKEVIVYDLLNRHSQLASRANYARVTLNGEPWGLYSNVESADDQWLKRRFQDDYGNFWGTGASYGDFYTEWLDIGWELKSGDGDRARFHAMIAALDAYQGDFFGELGPLVNVDQWLDYWAWCAAVGNYDGYPFVVNDVLIYEDPANGGRFTFAPWGTDESWAEYEVTGQTWNAVSARLGYACLADEACVTELRAHIATAAAAYESADVMRIAQAAWDLSEADVQTDPKRPFNPSDVWSYRDYYEGVIPGYADYVRGKVGL